MVKPNGNHQMQRAELLAELKQLEAMEFDVVEEAINLAQEIDMSSFASMSVRAAAVVVATRGLQQRLGDRNLVSLMRSRSTYQPAPARMMA
ncbi:MAG: hypothetical protein RL001_1753 [Pseudomonadota bacterium]|jgi:hypothetical protein